MYEKVLLAYDGSAEGRSALREGARLARLCGSSVFLLAVVDVSPGIVMAEGAAPGAVDQQQEGYAEILAEGVRRLRDMGFTPDARLGVGDPGQQIAEVAAEIDADLVVVGHRHQGRLERWWRGSVGAGLLDRLTCSLLIARHDMTLGEAAGEDA